MTGGTPMTQETPIYYDILPTNHLWYKKPLLGAKDAVRDTVQVFQASAVLHASRRSQNGIAVMNTTGKDWGGDETEEWIVEWHMGTNDMQNVWLATEFFTGL